MGQLLGRDSESKLDCQEWWGWGRNYGILTMCLRKTSRTEFDSSVRFDFSLETARLIHKTPVIDSSQEVFFGHLLYTLPCKSKRNSYIVVQLLSRVQLFLTLWTAACQASLSFTLSWSLLELMPMSQWCHPTSSSSVARFSSCLHSFPESGSFPVSRLFSSGGQHIGASASVLPMNIQDWFPLGMTGWISCSPRDSQESSPTPQFESISSSVLSLLYGPTLTSVHG